MCLSTWWRQDTSEPSVECVQTSQEDEISERPISETSPVDSWKCVVTVNDAIDSLTKTLSNCQEQLRLAEQQLVRNMSR